MAGGEADDSEGAALITTEDVAALAAAAYSDNMVAADASGAAVEASSTAAPAIPREPAAVPVSSNNSVGTTGTGATGEDLVHKARGLMRRIVAGRASPNPCLLHALAGILEQEESRSVAFLSLGIWLDPEAVLVCNRVGIRVGKQKCCKAGNFVERLGNRDVVSHPW